MPKTQPSSNSSPFMSPVGVFLLVILAVLVGMFAQSLLSGQQGSLQLVNMVVPQVEEETGTVKYEQPEVQEKTPAPTCDKYARSGYEGYLPTYTVQSGDSLLSIAKQELSAARVQEIVELNKERYPSLEERSPFLEAGWILYLPPEQAVSTNGKLIVTHGNISKSEVGWGINAPNQGTGPFDLSYLDRFFGDRNNITEGECITVIYQAKSDFSEPLVVHEVRYQE